ncbi:MAG: hypothetical protein KA105_00235 [Caulobacter sp.]|nr:hypothetical protein [Caulobacter sp.]
MTRIEGVERPRLGDLSPEHRAIVEQTALEEIHTFGADDDPDAIERLAADGLQSVAGDEDADTMIRLVSEAQEEIAARLRKARAVAALACAMGSMIKLSLR